jgi:hypothetical protein
VYRILKSLPDNFWKNAYSPTNTYEPIIEVLFKSKIVVILFAIVGAYVGAGVVYPFLVVVGAVVAVGAGAT